jgi:REP element-mobilizing transposase RayT
MDFDSPRVHYRQRRLPSFNYATTGYSYFVTIRAKSGTAPFTNPRLAREVMASLHWLRAHRQVSLYAYCLMPDHLHLLLQLGTSDQTLGTVIGALKRYTTRQSWLLGTQGALWQPRFYDHIVRRAEDASQIAANILANPMRTGLVEDEATYPWSGMPDPMRG